MSNQNLLIDSVRNSSRLCKLWVFSYIVLFVDIIVRAVDSEADVYEIFIWLICLVLFVLDVALSAILIKNFSSILAIKFPDTESIEHQTLKFLKNILIAILVISAIILWVDVSHQIAVSEGTIWLVIFIHLFHKASQIVFFIKLKKFKSLCDF